MRSELDGASDAPSSAVDAEYWSGRAVVVTGASKGLGRAMALGFATAGASVVVASRSAERCEPVADEIRTSGGIALAVGAHMGRRDDIDGLAAAAVERFGRIDVVVNNAATNPVIAPLLDTGDELAEKLYSVNVVGPLRLARLAVADMRRRDEGGVVLNIVSKAAFNPEAGMGPYVASKAALVGLTKVMAFEWAQYGVRVNAIAPGPFATVMVDRLFAQDEYREALVASTAQRRIAHPEEIVGAALYLTGPNATFTTGTVVHVDGGMLD